MTTKRCYGYYKAILPKNTKAGEREMKVRGATLCCYEIRLNETIWI